MVNIFKYSSKINLIKCISKGFEKRPNKEWPPKRDASTRELGTRYMKEI